MPDELETVDIDGVEVFRSGGPYFGQGSPPEGETYTPDDVRKLVTDTAHLVGGGVAKSVVKIGHSAAQKLAKSLGLHTDEMPALGLQDGFRIQENDDGTVSAMADWRQVPKELAAQIEAGR